MAIVHLPGKTYVNADALCRDVIQLCKPLIKSIHIEHIIPLTSLFAEKEKQPADSSYQQRGVEELNSTERHVLASGPLDLRYPYMYIWLSFRSYPLTARIPQGRGVTSTEDITKKQCDEPAFRCLTNFLES